MVSILLVEDNEMNRDMMTLRLSRNGFDVVTAHDGLEAITLCKNRRFDLVLMDLNLPELDGWDATQRIREREAGGTRTPIIALSASATTEQRDRAMNAGCDAFVSKPVNMENLLFEIRRFLGGADE